VRAKSVALRAAADLDVDTAVEHYLTEAGVDVATAFMNSLEEALGHLSKHPGTGSPKPALRMNIPGLRSWPLSRFPYLVFYLELADEVAVVRVLHGAMDHGRWLN
jgi:toxin ParE1/3/4